MNYKLTTTLIIVQSILHLALQSPFMGNNYDTFEYNCNLILSSMNFLRNQRCVQFIFGHELYSVRCIKEIIENNKNVTFYIRSMHWLLKRNVHEEESFSNVMNKKSTRYCENFLVLLKDLSSLQSLLKAVQNNAKVVTFFPHTKLYFLFVERKVQYFTTQTLTEISKYFYTNSQFGYLYEFDAAVMKMRDLLSSKVESNHTIRSNFIHPFLNRKNDDKEFRMSFYNCSPFVVYVDEENFRFDGIEYRLIQEVIKNWKIQHILRDESKTGITPWITMFDDLKNHTADIAMCSIWISIFDDKYDVSGYYNHECDTLMVPKPQRLSEITAIYRTLSGQVWLTFGLFFFATGILLRSSATVGIVERTVYIDISRSFLEVVNIATSHGVDILLRQQTSIKILLMSWTLACTWIGICYTTIYTSRLSKPGYTKTINTIEDFNENDMYWATYHEYTDITSSLNTSSNPAYNELNRRIFIFKNPKDAEIGLASGKFGVYAGISNSKYFVTYDWNEQLHALSKFRLIKKDCIFNHYTVFALQKFSPYTELFTHYALKFQEHGITQFWFQTVYRDKTGLNTFFEDHPQENNEPTALNFNSIRGALLVLFVSHIFSGIVFICELAINNFKPVL